MNLDPRDIVRAKRDGARLTREEMSAFLGEYVAGNVTEEQAAALLACISVRGMEPDELVEWTLAMRATGEQLTWDLDRPVVDKHSTGGVGDKVSLVLAPALAACGVAVPMISGRGLGHTGGTLDKLEAIPGFKSELALERVKAITAEVGCVIAAQTAELVPADRGLYALRDATGLVESLPLIASSILSKKLAEGLDALVLDVKYGSGAFLGDPEEGERLARQMIEIASGAGLNARVLQTSMEEPLGQAIGHSIEVAECLDVLRAGGPDDLRELVVELGAAVLDAAGIEADLEATLDDGRAMDVFEQMVRAQGGDLSKLPAPKEADLFLSPSSGVLDVTDCRAMGRAVLALGGGRRKAGDKIDPVVGVRFLRRIGDEVRAGELLAEIVHSGSGVEEARECLSQAIAFDTGREAGPLVRTRLG